MDYSEYIAQNLDKNIKYTEYLAEHLDKNIQYADYIAENLNSIDYTEYVNEAMKDPAQKKREMREKKLNRIFKDFQIPESNVETPIVEKKSSLHDIKMWFYK